MLNRRQLLGQRGETIACNYLKQHGYKIVQQNFRCTFGELDIIANDGNTLVIVEVKTRSSNNFGPPAAAVGFKKQSQICRATQIYLADHDTTERDIRFDVVSILIGQNGPPEIELLIDAFEFCL